MSASTNHRVLLVGAGGMLGSAIAKAILDPLDNARYADVQPETVEQFARRTGKGNARDISHSAP